MFSYVSVLGALALSGGIMSYFVFPLGLKMGVKMSVNLAENGLVFPIYMNPPFATRSEFHLFDILNPREVLRGDKMNLRIKGPYVYKTMLERSNVQFSQGSERVKFNSRRRLYLDESQSANMDERMWLINPILPSMLKSIRSIVLDRMPFKRMSEPIVFNAVNLLLDTYKERLMTRTTPRAFLQGKTVELLVAVTNLAARFGLASLIPPGPPDNIFGLAYAQNETVDVAEVFTGLGKTSERYAEVASWKGNSEVTVWRGNCRSIKGTNGELYKPLLAQGRPIRIFLGPLCRSFLLEPVLETNDSSQQQQQQLTGHKSLVTTSGVRALEYMFTPRIYMGARSNPSNQCFCEDARTLDCQYDGLLSMGPCFFDAPLYFARANFEGVDERISGTTNYLKTVDKLLPSKQNFAIEQLTGAVQAVNLTLMGLFKVVRQPYMRDLARVRNLTYVPTFTTTEIVATPYEHVWQLYWLQVMQTYYEPAAIGTAGLGAVALLAKRFLLAR